VRLTTIVETTHVVDPEDVGGHLLYVSKYVDAGHADQDRPLDEVKADYLRYAQTIFPDLRDDEILGAVVQRARVTEPVHLLGGARNLPEMFPAGGLGLASTAHVYPEIVSGQAVAGVAQRVVPGILERLSTDLKAAA
jgi:protoporphyrinogen oxidase